MELRPTATGGAEIEVRDTGVGIDAAELPRIFDRFYRGSRSNEARGSGSGLGPRDRASRSSTCTAAGSASRAAWALGPGSSSRCRRPTRRVRTRAGAQPPARGAGESRVGTRDRPERDDFFTCATHLLLMTTCQPPIHCIPRNPSRARRPAAQRSPEPIDERRHDVATGRAPPREPHPGGPRARRLRLAHRGPLERGVAAAAPARPPPGATAPGAWQPFGTDETQTYSPAPAARPGWSRPAWEAPTSTPQAWFETAPVSTPRPQPAPDFSPRQRAGHDPRRVAHLRDARRRRHVPRHQLQRCARQAHRHPGSRGRPDRRHPAAGARRHARAEPRDHRCRGLGQPGRRHDRGRRRHEHATRSRCPSRASGRA